MSEKQQTHYDVEDEPKADVETSLAMYEQSKAVVAKGTERAETILGEAGPILEQIYNIASASQNTEVMAAVNAAWTKTQELAQIVGQHGAALNGADVVIDVVKKSRDAALDELSKILKGLEEEDDSAHPAIASFRQNVEEWVNEWAYEDAYEYADERLSEELSNTLDELVKHESMSVRYRTVANLMDTLRGDIDMTDVQKELVVKLLETCMPATVRAALGLDAEEEGDSDE